MNIIIGEFGQQSIIEKVKAIKGNLFFEDEMLKIQVVNLLSKKEYKALCQK